MGLLSKIFPTCHKPHQRLASWLGCCYFILETFQVFMSLEWVGDDSFWLTMLIVCSCFGQNENDNPVSLSHGSTYECKLESNFSLGRFWFNREIGGENHASLVGRLSGQSLSQVMAANCFFTLPLTKAPIWWYRTSNWRLGKLSQLETCSKLNHLSFL